jgi:hypothetical protein
MRKIRSLPNWQNDYPAFAWCASLGDGWYLPALKELEAINAQREAINNALKAKEKSIFDSFYWSSTQDNEYDAYSVFMIDGYTLDTFKDNNRYVRAVSAFSAEGSASSSKTSAPYKVGDYYNDGKKEGVVFAVSNNGYSGKIVGLEQNDCRWSEKDARTGATSKSDGMYNMQKIRSLQNWQNDYPAFEWCASLGDGWYLPALKELNVIYAQRAVINNTLKAKGKPELENSWHLSSTQYDKSCAWLVDMNDGDTFRYAKPIHIDVCAVAAF